MPWKEIRHEDGAMAMDGNASSHVKERPSANNNKMKDIRSKDRDYSESIRKE